MDTKMRGVPGRLGVPPVTAGGPPVWVGGHSDAALRRTLRFGDGWYGTGADAAEVTNVRRRLRDLAGAENADRLTLASAAFLTPPGLPAAVPPPGRPLGGTAPTAASVADDLGRLAEAGLTACTLWLPVAAEHVERLRSGSQPRWHRDSPDAVVGKTVRLIKLPFQRGVRPGGCPSQCGCERVLDVGRPGRRGGGRWRCASAGRRGGPGSARDGSGPGSAPRRARCGHLGGQYLGRRQVVRVVGARVAEPGDVEVGLVPAISSSYVNALKRSISTRLEWSSSGR